MGKGAGGLPKGESTGIKQRNRNMKWQCVTICKGNEGSTENYNNTRLHLCSELKWPRRSKMNYEIYHVDTLGFYCCVYSTDLFLTVI
jgi:hypothetical protein